MEICNVDETHLSITLTSNSYVTRAVWQTISESKRQDLYERNVLAC